MKEKSSNWHAPDRVQKLLPDNTVERVWKEYKLPDAMRRQIERAHEWHEKAKQDD